MRFSMTRLGAAIASVGLLLGTATLVASPASAADCNNSVGWTTGLNTLHSNAFKADYTPIRNGPYLACGQVSNGHKWTDVRLHCVGYNDNWVVWTHLRNTNYATQGWVLGSSLTAAAQNVYVRLC